MAKVHLRNGKINTGLAKCGNNGRHYAYGLDCRTPQEFKKVAAKDRCAHCEDIYLTKRNQQRKEKGLPAVETAFEGLESSD